jgi:hypothetical protein
MTCAAFADELIPGRYNLVCLENTPLSEDFLRLGFGNGICHRHVLSILKFQ